MALFFIWLSSLEQILQNETWNMYLWYTTTALILTQLPIIDVCHFPPTEDCVRFFIVIPNVETIHCCSSERLQDIVQHENKKRKKVNRSLQMSFTRKLYSFYNSHNFNLFCHPNGVAFRNFLMCFYAVRCWYNRPFFMQKI